MLCVCCGSNQIRKKGVKYGYPIYACNKCHFCFVHPLPAKDDIQKHYNKTRISKDIKNYVQKAINEIEHSSNCPKRDWYKMVLEYVSNYCNRETLDILDIGSAYGYFIHYANSLGHNAIGTEVTQEYADASKGIINGQIIYIENNQYDRYFDVNMFDLIYMEHVLEHIIDPVSVLKCIKKILKINGLLFISVPNHNSLLSQILNYRWAWFCPPEHLYYYNAKALTQLLESNEMEILQVWTGDYYFRSIYQFYSLDFIWRKLAVVSNKLFNTNFKKRHSYKYPRNPFEIINLLPYWILYPIIKLSAKCKMGSELIIIAKKVNKRLKLL